MNKDVQPPIVENVMVVFQTPLGYTPHSHPIYPSFTEQGTKILQGATVTTTVNGRLILIEPGEPNPRSVCITHDMQTNTTTLWDRQTGPHTLPFDCRDIFAAANNTQETLTAAWFNNWLSQFLPTTTNL